jgi:hypothetical protein
MIRIMFICHITRFVFCDIFLSMVILYVQRTFLVGNGKKMSENDKFSKTGRNKRKKLPFRAQSGGNILTNAN